MKYNLSGFFNEYKKRYPQFKDIVNDYERQLKELKITMNHDVNNVKDEDQYYQQLFQLPMDSFYIIDWNVEQALKTATKYYKNGPNMKFNVPIVYDAVRKDAIVQSYLDEASRNNNPIILGYHPGITHPNIIVIDGNHRVASRARQGVNDIYGYFLSPKMHLECMMTNLDQLLYKIHHNLYKHVIQSQGGPLKEIEYDDEFIS